MSAISNYIKGTIEVGEDSLVLEVDGHNSAIAQVTGTWSGVVAFEGTVDDTNWFAISGTPIPTGSATSSTENNGQWSFTVSGLIKIRLRVSPLNSGSVECSIRSVV